MKISWGHLFLAWWVVLASTAVSTAPHRRPPACAPALGGRPSPRALQAAATAPPSSPQSPSKAFVDTYCATCHNQRLKTAGLALDTLDVDERRGARRRSGRRWSSSCAPG